MPCSSCGAMLTVQVLAMEGQEIACGMRTELRCACGAGWKLSAVLPGVNVYLGSVA